MKEIIALIIIARRQLKLNIKERKKNQYWSGVLSVLHSHNFMLLLSGEMKRNNCSVSQTLEIVSKLDEVYLNGKRNFKQDDMIEIKGAINFLTEFHRDKNCT